MKKFIQFQLWRECASNCSFCYLKGMKDVHNKADALIQTIEYIKSLDFSQYNEIGLTGGEFFAKQLSSIRIANLFYSLNAILAKLLYAKKISKVYITTSLLAKDLSELFECLDIYKHYKVSNQVLICTSYDTKYRFKNEISEELWKSNMKHIYSIYPEVMLHTEIICTQDFISKVLNNKISIKQLEKEYHTKINYIKPQCNTTAKTKEEFDKQLPNFLLHRQDFLRFLKKCKTENLLDLNELFNYSLHSDEYAYFDENNKMHILKDRCKNFNEGCLELSKLVGRTLSVLEYIDSNASIDNDVNFFKEV